MAQKMLINDTTLTAIADAIRAKNGSEDTMLPSEMAGLIEAIENSTVIKTGTFTAQGSVTTKTATHDLGVIPKFAAVIANGSGSMNGQICAMVRVGDEFKYQLAAGTSNGGAITSASSVPGISWTETKITFAGSTSYKFGAGDPYYWFLGV